MLEFLQEHSLWLVLIIALLGWGGIWLYLMRLDRKVSELEKKL
jgi:hypothetical protein